jgi:hypothetical protein
MQDDQLFENEYSFEVIVEYFDLNLLVGVYLSCRSSADK